jgi:hypothetical protein
MSKTNKKLLTFCLMMLEVALVGLLLPELGNKVYYFQITPVNIMLISTGIYSWIFITEIISEILILTCKGIRRKWKHESN